MSDGQVVEISATSIALLIGIAVGWFGAAAALADAIRRRARGSETAGTWVVFLAISLIVIPLAGLAALAYLAAAISWERQRPRGRPQAEDLPVASRAARALAALVDSLVIGVPMSALVWRFSTIDLGDRIFEAPGWISWLGWAAAVSYHVIAVAVWGQTIGKHALGIDVVAQSGGRPSLASSIKRATPMVLSRVPYVGSVATLMYLPVLWRGDRRGAHDLLAGTAVVRRTADLPQLGSRLKWVTGTIAVLVICAAVAFAGEADRPSRHLTVTVTTTRIALWENGRPHAENMQRAREIVERCLGSGVEPGEPAYDYIATPLEHAQLISSEQSLQLRVIGTDSQCDRQALNGPIRADRLNVYVVDDRVVWSRIF